MISSEDRTRVHDLLDDLNAKYGTADELCLWCGSSSVDPVVGIVHDQTCIIQVLRGLHSV